MDEHNEQPDVEHKDLAPVTENQAEPASVEDLEDTATGEPKKRTGKPPRHRVIHLDPPDDPAKVFRGAAEERFSVVYSHATHTFAEGQEVVADEKFKELLDSADAPVKWTE
nr:hypothetical protein [uncultured Lichenicoccus sp.]